MPRDRPPLSNQRFLDASVAAAVAVLLALALVGLTMQAGVSASALVSNKWARAQKSAVGALREYVRTGAGSDLAEYERHFAVLDAVRRARTELAKDDADAEAFHAAMEDAGIDRFKSSSILRLDRVAGRLDGVERLMRLWSEGDAHVLAIDAIARAGSVPKRNREADLTEIRRRDAALTVLEDEFARILTGFTYGVYVLLCSILIAAAIAVAAAGSIHRRRLFRRAAQRELAEQKLRRSEAQREAMLEASPDAMLLLGRDLVYRDVVPGHVRDGRLTPSIVGRHITEMLPPDRAKTAAELVEAAIATRQMQSFEYQLTIDGKPRDYEARFVAIDDDEVVVFIRDTTAAVDTIRALMLSDERFKLVANATKDAVWDWDIESDRVWRSPMFHALFGRTDVDDDSYEGWQHRIHPADRERVLLRIFKALQSEESSWDEHYRFLRADSTYAIVHERSCIVRDPNGKATRMIGAMTDVSAEHLAEARRSEIESLITRAAEEWRATFDSVDTPILLLDREALVIRLNRTALQWASDGFPGAVGAPVASLCGGRLTAIVRALIDGSAPAVVREITDDAGRIWSVRASRREHAPTDRVAAVIVAVEITQLMALQQSLRRSETLAAMGSLVAGVAHEVRNPLFGISATVDAFEPELTEKGLDDFVFALREQVERLTQLMTDLLDYGKPPRFLFSRGDLRSVVPQAVRAVAQHRSERSITIDESYDPDVPNVMLDKGRILQVLENLLHNAIAHTPRGGRIEIAVRTMPEGARSVTCSVRDSGSGFDPGDIPRLFDPFFSKRRGGTGLGLAIAQKIVEAHGGRIAADNHPGGGGIVTISFDAAPLRD